MGTAPGRLTALSGLGAGGAHALSAVTQAAV